MNTKALALTILALAALSCTARAQDDSSKPWWNPFSGSSKESSTKATDSGKSSGSFLRMPELGMPTMPWATNTSTRSSEPSALQKFGASSKKMWNNTVDFMNPFDSPKTESVKSNGYRPQELNRETKSGTGWFGWMWREEKIESPTTLHEWAGQDHPRW